MSERYRCSKIKWDFITILYLEDNGTIASATSEEESKAEEACNEEEWPHLLGVGADGLSVLTRDWVFWL